MNYSLACVIWRTIRNAEKLLTSECLGISTLLSVFLQTFSNSNMLTALICSENILKTLKNSIDLPESGNLNRVQLDIWMFEVLEQTHMRR